MIFTVQYQNYLDEWADKLNACRQRYADHLGVEYKVYTDDGGWIDHMMSIYPQFSMYDTVNFYKHWVMRILAEKYDQVCYMDFDCFPNTTQSIFDGGEFWSGGHYFEVEANRSNIRWNKKSIRSRTAKYWHSYAMCMEQGIPFNKIVYNTGLMVASSEDIKKLDYFETFDEDISMMELVKRDPFYEPRSQIFAYDNETLFNYLLSKRKVKCKVLPDNWHCKTKEPAEMYHLYGPMKDFEYYEDILC